MVESRRSAIALLLFTVLSSLTAARAAPMEAQAPAPSEAVSVPPLVPAEPAPELVPAPEELTPAPDLIGVPMDADAPEVQSGSSIPLPFRGLLESMGAGVTGVVGGLVGILLMNQLSGCGGEECLGPLLLGAMGGAALGVPVGVFGAGRLMGVRGGLGSSYLGLLVGGGGALLASVLINSASEDGEGTVFISVPVAAVLGSVIGFELSEDTTPAQSRPEPRRGSSSPALLLSPTAGTTSRGGFIGGVSGRF